MRYWVDGLQIVVVEKSKTDYSLCKSSLLVHLVVVENNAIVVFEPSVLSENGVQTITIF